jgi:hypothetical protein
MAYDPGVPYLSDDDILSIELRNKCNPDSDIGRLLREREALLDELDELRMMRFEAAGEEPAELELSQ